MEPKGAFYKQKVEEIRRIHRRPDGFDPADGDENDNPHGRFATLRQILNVLFMAGAVAGIIVYFNTSHHIGTVIILISMIFKFIECVLRLLK